MRKKKKTSSKLTFFKSSVYKALLFLGAGAVIHAVSDNQDQYFLRSNTTKFRAIPKA